MGKEVQAGGKPGVEGTSREGGHDLVSVQTYRHEVVEAWCSSPRRWVQPGEGDARTDDRGCRLAG